MNSLPPSSILEESESEKLKRKNSVLKMMYCGNCAETADESKTKSRQIACKRVNTLKNAVNAVRRLGSWNTAMKGAEGEGQRFSKEAKY